MKRPASVILRSRQITFHGIIHGIIKTAPTKSKNSLSIPAFWPFNPRSDLQSRFMHNKKAGIHQPGFPPFLNIYPQNHTLYISFHPFLFPLFPKPTWLSPRPISDSQLHTLPHFHLCPIYLVVFKGSYSCDGISHLEGGFTLRCLQRLSLPDLATRPWV